MLPKRLVEITPTLYVTRSVWYGKKNRLIKRHFSQLIQDVIKIENELGLKGHKFILRPIKRKAFGLSFPAKNISYIDPCRKTYDEFIATFLHEGLHLKQIQRGDLQWNRTKQALMWKDQVYLNADSAPVDEIAFNEYKELPWEAEVSKKIGKLYMKIFNKELPETNKKVKL